MRTLTGATKTTPIRGLETITGIPARGDRQKITVNSRGNASTPWIQDEQTSKGETQETLLYALGAGWSGGETLNCWTTSLKPSHQISPFPIGRGPSSLDVIQGTILGTWKNLIIPGAEITDSRGYPDPTPSEELDSCLYIIMVVPSLQLEMEGEECTPGTNGKNQAAHLQLKNTRPVWKRRPWEHQRQKSRTNCQERTSSLVYSWHSILFRRTIWMNSPLFCRSWAHKTK